MIIAVFRSRAQSLDYAEHLREYGVRAETIPTPKEANIGCGLCVRFDASVYVRATAVLKRMRYTTFKVFYKVEFVYGRQVITRFDGR